MERIGYLVEALVTKTTTIFTWISGLTILAMMGLIVADVTARYLLKSPMKGAMDLGQMMLILIGFLGMAYTQSEKGHVRVEFVTARLSGSKQLVLETITSILGAFIVGLMAIQMARHGFHILASSEAAPKTNLLFIPHAPFILIAALGCLLFSLRLVLDVIVGLGRIRSTTQPLKAEEEPP